MLHRANAFLLSFCLFAGSYQPSVAQETNSRKKTLLDNNWSFHFGHAANPLKDFNYKIVGIFSKSGKAETTAIDPKFDDKSWRKLNLPHDWAVELPFARSENPDVMAHGYKPVGGLFPETSIGWYRRKFSIARPDSGKRFEVQFDGIFRDAEIWLNGFFLGNNKSGYLGAVYDITDYVNFNKENVLVVRADASQYEGWFYEGAGIYRHVWLNQYDNIHVPTDGVFVHAEQKGAGGLFTVETMVENLSEAAAAVSVSAYITDRNGKKLTEDTWQNFNLPRNDRFTARNKVSLGSARLWSLEDPYLYKVISLVKVNGRIVDSVKTRTGLRTIKIDPEKGFFLNGKHVKIKGTNNHQDHAGVGSAIPDELHYYRLRLLKELGCNAYRMSHNAPAPELLDACDSLGILVMDEQRLLNSGPEYMGQFGRLIRRDRNHPSVFMWSIGNEEGFLQTNTVGKRLAQTMVAKQLELDSTRTSVYAADLANVFGGINEVIPVRGFNYRQFGVADYHRDHPGQPVIGTEMGSTVTTRGIYEKDSIRAYVPDQDITAPWWASRAEEWWKLAAVNDYWMGGFIWTGFDYRGEPTPYKWPNISSHFGVMDVCGFPKNIYYYYQSWWTDKDVLHISPHWNWKGKEGQPVEVWVNSNADNVELFLNGKSQGKKQMEPNSHLKWTVSYQPGTLKAVAYKKGKKLESAVSTTSVAYRIKIEPVKNRMQADGRDISVLNVTVLDKNGREVPDAGNQLKFSVQGNAVIIGVGNGDPSSHEPDRCLDGDWKRKLFNGKCQIIVQAGTKAGKVKIVTEGDGLVPAAVELLAD